MTKIFDDLKKCNFRQDKYMKNSAYFLINLKANA